MYTSNFIVGKYIWKITVYLVFGTVCGRICQTMVSTDPQDLFESLLCSCGLLWAIEPPEDVVGRDASMLQAWPRDTSRQHPLCVSFFLSQSESEQGTWIPELLHGRWHLTVVGAGSTLWTLARNPPGTPWSLCPCEISQVYLKSVFPAGWRFLLFSPFYLEKPALPYYSVGALEMFIVQPNIYPDPKKRT